MYFKFMKIYVIIFTLKNESVFIYAASEGGNRLWQRKDNHRKKKAAAGWTPMVT